jgi:hypothetical protein
MNPEEIAGRVMRNCSIANARNWGSYSVCGLLLRLRELYRWGNGIEPWEAIDHGSLLAWIDMQEREWEGMADRDFMPLEIGGVRYDPFSVEEINGVLEGVGLAYGAGYSRALRPSFFLGEVLERRREDGFLVIVLGEELARDLVSFPALGVGRWVFARKQPIGFYLWEKLLEARGQRKGILAMAFQDYGYDFSRAPEEQIGLMEDVINEELQAYLRHEMGEALEDFPEAEWREMVSRHPGTRVEHFARGVRDLLADTCGTGMLRHIIKRRNLGSLGMYAANLSGYRKRLLPDMVETYLKVRETGDWGLVEKNRIRGYDAARRHAAELVELYRREGDSGRFEELAERMLSRLRL